MILWHTMALTTAAHAVIRAEFNEETATTVLIINTAQNPLKRVFGNDAPPPHQRCIHPSAVLKRSANARMGSVPRRALLEAVDDCRGELRALDLGGPVHQSSEVIGNDLVGHRRLHSTDDVVRRVLPSDVFEHEHA